jgi:hypothetical protein
MTSHHDDYQTPGTQQLSEPGRRPIGRMIFDSICVILLVAAVGYLGWFSVSATRSVSRSLAGPETVVRLQIVNATSDPTLGKAVAGVLARTIDHRMSFAVVDTARFSSRKVHRSFLVARDNDPVAAKAVAQLLGIEADRVTVLPLEHNNRNVSVTLVLGDDYRSLSLRANTGKETDRKT